MIARLSIVLSCASVLLLSGISLHSCSPNGPEDPYPQYRVYFDNPPASGTVGIADSFWIVHKQTQDLDSLYFENQDSATGAQIAYFRVNNVYPWTDSSLVIGSFATAGARRLSALGYYQHNVTKRAQIYFHIYAAL